MNIRHWPPLALSSITLAPDESAEPSTYSLDGAPVLDPADLADGVVTDEELQRYDENGPTFHRDEAGRVCLDVADDLPPTSQPCKN